MRLSLRIAKRLIAGIVLFMGIGPAALSADTIQWRAQVQSLKGKATWSTNSGVVHPLKVNSILPAGSTIKTGPESSVDLFLGYSAGVVRLGPDTTFSLEKLTVTDTGADKVVDVQVNLPAGEMFFNVNKLSKASRYEIKIPNGVAGIRGTGGRCHVPPLARIQDTEIVLVDGSLAFVWTPPGGGNPVPISINAPPPVVWRPNEGVKPAPDELVRAVLASINQIRRPPNAPPGPPPGVPRTEPPISPSNPRRP
jgi:hypothetical protein